jgi:protein associated with RNAse G/E
MQQTQIKSYKHDGSSHRMWSHTNFLKEDDEFYYLAATRAKVIEHDGREWRAPEGSIYILSKKHFYNIIVMFISNRVIEYYVNIASPTLRTSLNTFEFIDYDLDLKKDKQGKVKELDWGEYHRYSENYGYSDELKKVIELTLKEVGTQLKAASYPFSDEENYKMYNDYLSQIEDKYYYQNRGK